MDIEVYEKEPDGFSPQVQVAACYLEVETKLLLLQRRAGGSEPEKWTVPAGKLEKGEAPKEAALRELFEETGISVCGTTQIQDLGLLYMRKPTIDYVYHLFKVRLEHIPDVCLSHEHLQYKWVSSEEMQTLPLVAGAKQALQSYRSFCRKKRPETSVNVYLILNQKGKLLFHLRKGTGYYDNMWGLVSGHVEDTESATAAMIREAKEEIGIELSASDLKVAHVAHVLYRQSNRLNIDLFFTCSTWKGVIKNCEPRKCGGVHFFSLEALPPNTIDYITEALRAIQNKELYSERGFF